MTPRDYFNESAAAYRAVPDESSVDEETFLIAGRGIRFTFASASLKKAYATGLRHLSAGDSALPEHGVDLTIHFWEGDENPIPPPFLETDRPSFAGARIEHLCDGDITTQTAPHSGLVSTFSLRERCGYAWIRDSRAIPAWETFSPLGILLNSWLSTKSSQMIHAGAVSWQGKGLILAGPSGSGKTTTALTCLQAGFDYLSDDYCVATVRDTTPSEIRLYSLFRSARLIPESRPDLDLLSDHCEEALVNDGKTNFFVNFDPAAGRSGVPLTALLLPRITGDRETRILPSPSPTHTWMRFAPSTLGYLFGGGKETFRLLATIAREVPAFELLLGTDTGALVSTLKEFLQDHDAGTA